MPRGRAETEAFTLALVNLGARGQRTQCSDPGLSWLWLSDSYIERGEAVKLCRGCPVLEECRAAAVARRESFGVFGPKDFSGRGKWRT